MDRILVQDVEGHNEINVAIVLEDVLAHLVHNAGLCGVFVVDSVGLVSGALSVAPPLPDGLVFA
jgi:hypothetical protein